MFEGIRPIEIIVLAGLALLLFGGFKKMPDAARGLGRSLRIFKAETKGLVTDDSDELPAVTAGEEIPAPPQVVPADSAAAYPPPGQSSTPPAGQ